MSGDDPLTPTAGARFVLERRAADADGARYDGRILTPDATFAFDVRLEPGGEPQLAPRAADVDAGPAPDELVRGLAMFARLTARGVARRVEDGLPPWPARVTRWRGPGRGA